MTLAIEDYERRRMCQVRAEPKIKDTYPKRPLARPARKFYIFHVCKTPLL
jgi:hypothetical protein